MANWYVNINKHTIAANTKHGEQAPPIRVCKGKNGKGTYYSEVGLPPGSRLIYSPAEPLLKCGARLVIECPTEPEGIV